MTALEAPAPYEPITLQNLKSQIGLVQNFFLAKLHANHDEPLIEDEDLPQKQRFPKPRLPPTGKISSPRKRPIKEQGGGKSKKKKVEWKEGISGTAAGGAGGDGGVFTAASTTTTASAEKEKEKDKEKGVGSGNKGNNTMTTAPVGKLKLAVPGSAPAASSAGVSAGGNNTTTNNTTNATGTGEGGEAEEGGGEATTAEAENARRPTTSPVGKDSK